MQLQVANEMLGEKSRCKNTGMLPVVLKKKNKRSWLRKLQQYRHPRFHFFKNPKKYQQDILEEAMTHVDERIVHQELTYISPVRTQDVTSMKNR